MVRVANEYLACACRVQQDNPKKNMSADRYERYKAARTLQQVLDLGGSRGDIANDMLRGYIVVEDREMPLVITPARRVKVDIFNPPHPSQGVLGSLDESLPCESRGSIATSLGKAGTAASIAFARSGHTRDAY